MASSLLKEVTYPKNPERRRFRDQLVEDVLGEKIGNVPAKLCGLFRRLLDSGCVRSIKCFSSGIKPCPSRIPVTDQKFSKGCNGGMDTRGGGLVLDCKYEITVAGQQSSCVIEEIKTFLSSNEGEEELVE